MMNDLQWQWAITILFFGLLYWWLTRETDGKGDD